MDWWRARPTWQKVLIGIVGAMVLIAIIPGGDPDEPVQEAVATPTTMATTTTAEPETTTTSTTLAATTTVFELSTTAQRVLLAGGIEETRSDIIGVFEDVFPVETVDRLDYDAGDFVDMSVTTSFASLQEEPEERSNDAWAIMQTWGAAFSGFLEDGQFDPESVPGVRLVMNGQWEIECSGDFMARVADRRAGQAEMNQECSGLT